MTNYQEGKIYKLTCNDGHYYIGSTVQKLNLLFNHLKGLSKNNRLYVHITTIGWDKVKIELLESFPCNNKKELNKIRQKKQEERIEYDNTIITCECGGTYQNYRKKRHDLSKKHVNYVT